MTTPHTLKDMWFTLFCLAFMASKALGSTHWVVTPEGKIQSQVNSIFHMKRPYDLVAFLEQEKRVEQLEILKQFLADTSRLESVSQPHLSDLETNFYNNDEDCQQAGQPLTAFDLFVSTLIHPDPTVVPDVSQIIHDEYQNLNSYDQPFCDSVQPQFFELDVIDELSSTERRKVLKMSPETALTFNVLEKRRYHLKQYGHLVAESFKSAPKNNWVGPFLASNYWRIVGDASEAIVCLRKAVYSAPIQYKHLGLLSLANVFHRSHNSQDALATLELASKYSADNPAILFTMGNVHATLMQFNQSAKSYTDALRVQPQFDAAKDRKHAVLCHAKLEQALEEQHRQLEATLDELRAYKKQHEEWSSLLNKILAEQASLEVRMTSRMEYEEFKIKLSKNGHGQNCIQHNHAGSTVMTCSMHKNKDIHNDLWSLDGQGKKTDMEDLLKKIELKVESPAKVDLPNKEPSLPGKYDKWPALNDDHPLKDSSWPSAEDCAIKASKAPKWNDYPTVFLSPENAGFNVAKMMSDSIKIPLEFPAPLPWMPPTCKAYPGKTKQDQLPTLQRWTHITSRTPEREIEASYYQHSAEENFHEWGARVNTAMNMQVTPKWVVNLLAGTYWRIFGHPQNAIHCYRWALSSVPKKYEYIILTNLAGLLYKTGALEEALTVMKESISLNSQDPDSNFFMANLLSAKGNNITGALHHYRQSLQMRPHFTPALQYMLAPSCQAKFQGNEKKVSDLSCQSVEECHDKSLTSGDTMTYCKAGHCRRVTVEEYLALEYMMPEEVKSSSGSDKDSAKKKRSKKKKSKKTTEIPANILPKEGESTVLLDKTQVKKVLPLGAVEIGTIVETSVDYEDENQSSEEEEDSHDLELLSNVQEDAQKKEIGFIGPIHLVDDPVPDVMIKVREKLATPQPTTADCENAADINWDTFSSTWLSVSAKNIDIREYLGDYLEPIPNEFRKTKPYCPEVPASLLSFDHLVGVRQRKYLHVAPEAGLKEAFQGLTGEKQSVEEMAGRISMELERNSTSWVLSTAAALYWRVKGQATEAVQCLRHALYYAPRSMKDIPLVSLANILHRAGLYNDAIIVTNMALEISPKFVVTHFTMANIYVAKNELDLAVSFYLTTLALQSTFAPASDRLLAIRCFHGDKLKVHRSNLIEEPVIDEDPAYISTDL